MNYNDEDEIDGCGTDCSSCAGCGSDHDHSHEEVGEGMSPIITLTDEDGNDIKFEILDVVVLEDGKEFLVVAEAEGEDSDDVEVTILEIKQEDGEEVYDTVTDEALAQKVFDEFTAQQEDSEEEDEE